MAFVWSDLPTGANNKLTFGSTTSQTFNFIRDTSVAGPIRIEIGRFLMSGVTPPSPPTAYYEAEWPTANGTIIDLSPIGGVKYHNIRVRLVRVSNLAMQIAVDHMMTADEGTWAIEPPNATILNTRRLTTSHFSNPVNFSNTYPSVYLNNSLFLRCKVSLLDGSGEKATGQFEYQARFYNRGLNDSFSESTWSSNLFRNGAIVNNLSAFENTNIVFNVFTGSVAPARFWLAVAKTSNISEAQPFLPDTKLNKTFIGLNGLTSAVGFGIPNNAFASASVTSNGAAPALWTVDVELNASYFDDGDQYILIMGVERLDGVENSTYLEATTDDPPGITQGIITPKSFIYDPNTTELNASCFYGNVPYMRWKIGQTMLKQAYDDELFNAGKPGSFNSNIQSVDVFVSNILPTSDGVPPANIEMSLPVVFQDDPLSRWYYVDEFRIPEDWIDTTKYVVFKWTFLVGGLEEIIYYPITITTKGEDGSLTWDSLHGQPGDERLDSFLCDQDLYPIISADVEDETTGVTFGGQTIGILLQDGEITEEDPFSNNELDNLNEDAMTFPDPILDSRATIYIDPAQLSNNIQYCPIVLKVPQPIQVSPSSCPCVNISVVQQTQSCNENVCNIFVSAFAAFPITNDDVDTLSVEGVINGIPFGPITDTDTAVTTTVQVPNLNTITGSYEVRLSTNNGCVYNTSYLLNTSNQPVDQSFQSQEDCPCNPCYTSASVAINKTITDFNLVRQDGTLTTASAEGITMPVSVGNQSAFNNMVSQIQSWLDGQGGGVFFVSGYDTVPLMFAQDTCAKVLSYTCTGPGALPIPSTMLGSCQMCDYEVSWPSNRFLSNISNAVQGSFINFSLPNDPYSGSASGVALLVNDLQTIWNQQGYSGTWSGSSVGGIATIKVTNSGRQMFRVAVTTGATFDFVESCTI